MKQKRIFPAILGLLLAGCNNASAPGPSVPVRSQVAQARETAPVTLHIFVPPRPGLKAKYTSSSTASIEITYPTGNGRATGPISGWSLRWAVAT